MWDRDGVAIAAPQVGYTEKIVVINASARVSIAPAVLLNPEIVEHSSETLEYTEGCLSLPGYSGMGSRYRSVVVCWYDLQGVAQRTAASDYAARILQHEIDHLSGTFGSIRSHPRPS